LIVDTGCHAAVASVGIADLLKQEARLWGVDGDYPDGLG
jgi:hypothetical protein